MSSVVQAWSLPTSKIHAPQFSARASRDTLVRQGATLGANCFVVCGVKIGSYAFIGAGAVVNKDILNYALMVGVPARQIGWMSEYGEQLDLPLEGKSEIICPYTGTKYQLREGSLKKL